MSRYELLIFNKLNDLFWAEASPRPVKTIHMTLYIPKHERAIRQTLAGLRERGYVKRVGTRKQGGWVPAWLPPMTVAALVKHLKVA